MRSTPARFAALVVGACIALSAVAALADGVRELTAATSAGAAADEDYPLESSSFGDAGDLLTILGAVERVGLPAALLCLGVVLVVLGSMGLARNRRSEIASPAGGPHDRGDTPPVPPDAAGPPPDDRP